MIEVSKETLSEEVLRKMTKRYLGIRYKKLKNGDFMAYANAWTMLVDIYKLIKKKLT
jgi:hypothetical protein